ncbi:hypothetical protein LCGC14_1245470 [marine sediment metagenome]|uniref:Uncharacterized protein n=1 Tax=marine sediment metagenome TaxID=412755 RepID=A0A0F9P8J3_9ZZZZ
MKIINKLILLTLVLFLCGCDTQHTGEFVIVVECSLPPELCGVNDDELGAALEAMSEAEQTALIAGQIKPHSGFISKDK